MIANKSAVFVECPIQDFGHALLITKRPPPSSGIPSWSPKYVLNSALLKQNTKKQIDSDGKKKFDGVTCLPAEKEKNRIIFSLVPRTATNALQNLRLGFECVQPLKK
jgi:hypothetical protein